MDGQKVVKVFCHEEQAMDGLSTALNDALFDSADKANALSPTSLMPV